MESIKELLKIGNGLSSCHTMGPKMLEAIESITENGGSFWEYVVRVEGEEIEKNQQEKYKITHSLLDNNVLL